MEQKQKVGGRGDEKGRGQKQTLFFFVFFSFSEDNGSENETTQSTRFTAAPSAVAFCSWDFVNPPKPTPGTSRRPCVSIGGL